MKLILLGLGNPGVKYQDTRHNLGHWFVDRVARFYHTPFNTDEDFLVSKVTLTDCEIFILKSIHHMNLNGTGLSRFLMKNSLAEGLFMMIHDEINLPTGKVKLSFGKSSGGHNGVSHVIEELGFSPHRLRLGVDQNRLPDAPLSQFVLSKLSAVELKTYDVLFPKLIHALQILLVQGVSFACNYLNRYPIPNPSN